MIKGDAAQAFVGLLLLAIVMGVALFATAWTIDYWQAWAYLCVVFGGAAIITAWLITNDPALLKRRVRAGPGAEKRTSQKIVMLLATLGFTGLLLVPALDHRFGGSTVPLYQVIVGDLLTSLCFYLTFLVYRENTFASGTIEVIPDQKVISTGPYGLIRHPMYSAGLLIFFGTPLALGSYWGLLAIVVLGPAIIWRLLDEERVLQQNLPGYSEYCRKVRWRLLPRVY